MESEDKRKRTREYYKKWRKEHPEKSREYSRKYYKKNIDGMRKCHRKYYREHREQESERKREYRRKYPKETKERSRKYYNEHIVYERERHKKYHKLHPEKSRENTRRWSKNNPDKIREINIRYAKSHPEKIREYAIRKRSTPKGRIDDRMHSAIYQALRGNKAGRKWESLVGYTVEQLKRHLQNKFTVGMTWAKFMAGEIHIDHVVPKSHFKYKTAEDPQFKECWALHNLQPLWAEENRKKGNRQYQLPLL